jgi:hypothetical protein
VKNHLLGDPKKEWKNNEKIELNFAMAHRARPVKRPCSALWQNLRGPVVPGGDIVGGVISDIFWQYGTADLVLQIRRA